jgi:uncharacterized protein (TIGR03000 family)
MYGGGYNYYTAPYSCSGYGVYGGASYMHSAYPMTNISTGCYGYGMPVYTAPVSESMPLTTEPKMAPVDPKKTSFQPTSDRAVVAVRLPADAKLYADGQLTELTSSERKFYTPSLNPNQRYQYELKVEYVRAGKPVQEAKKVVVKAGETTEVEFVENTALASYEEAVSKVTIRVPADAVIFVDDQMNDVRSTVREFRTPQLPKGKTFGYQFRAEVMREGKKVSQVQSVTFKAGENVNVDFRDMETVQQTATNR